MIGSSTAVISQVSKSRGGTFHRRKGRHPDGDLALQSAAALSTVIQSGVDSTPEGRARAPHSRTAARMGCVAGRTVCYFQSFRRAAWLPSLPRGSDLVSLVRPLSRHCAPDLVFRGRYKRTILFMCCVYTDHNTITVLLLRLAGRGNNFYLIFLPYDDTGMESPDLLLRSNLRGNTIALMSLS